MKDVKAKKRVDPAEKAFTQSLWVSAISILLCMIALCSVTYAWFAEDVTTERNRIEAGTFDLTVTVTAADGSEILTERGTDGAWRATLPASQELYTVTLTVTDNTSVKGFCLVANDADQWQSGLIAVGETTFTFTVAVNGADASLRFAPQWGIPADPAILQGGTLTVE